MGLPTLFGFAAIPYSDQRHIEHNIKELYTMAAIQQSDLDALTARVTAQDATINTLNGSVNEIKSLVSTAAAAGQPSLDISALKAVLDKQDADLATLKTDVGAVVSEVTPASPAPAA